MNSTRPGSDFLGVLGRTSGTCNSRRAHSGSNGVEQVFSCRRLPCRASMKHATTISEANRSKDSLHKRFVLLRFNYHHNPDQSEVFFWLFTASATAGVEVAEELETREGLDFHRTGSGTDRSAAPSFVNKNPIAFNSSAVHSGNLLVKVPRWRNSTFQQCDGTEIGPLALLIVLSWQMRTVTTYSVSYFTHAAPAADFAFERRPDILISACCSGASCWSHKSSVWTVIVVTRSLRKHVSSVVSPSRRSSSFAARTDVLL